MEDKINIDDLITHTLPLDRINENWVAAMQAANRSIPRFEVPYRLMRY
ncbi:hypothetical protein WJ542_15930 [Paraburkholderia sp. B3]